MKNPELEALFLAARTHGQCSEPDHEVGDLQDVLRTCWLKMSTDQRAAVYKEHAHLIEEWLSDADPR